ncbi:acetate--CoA ligase family protein [Tateyamaria pelophila]|uniref:acetate--CoA ligase family protein n=1 Tax=Tateyamaria pelophila TaxID=328415 RepID=UPI001CBE3BD1|nr:acetate--CoA ligase family protein [Tateyamaria pelophila]
MTKSKLSIDVGAGVLGYTHGLRQYSRAMRLAGQRPHEFFEEDAKKYLNEKLEIPEPSDLDVSKVAGVELDPVIERFVGFTGLVAGHALQSSSIYAFERIKVLSAQAVSPSRNQFRIQFLAPTVARLNPTFLKNAFEFAATIALEFTLPAYKRKQIKTLTDNSLVRFIETTRAQANGGYSMRFILEQAFDQGIPISHLGFGHYQFGYGRHAKVFCRSATPNDSLIGAQLTFNKLKCVTYMKSAGIPVPISRAARDAKEAQAIAHQIGFPVVLKPSNRDRGEGVTVDVQNNSGVVDAFERAKKVSNSILVENRVPGICHRLLVYRDQLIFAYARHPLSAIGDGTSSIRELIEKMQQLESKKAKHLRKKTCTLDELAITQLHRQNCDPETVPESGQIVYLRPYEGEVWGGYDENLTEKVVHPANADLACRTARLFGLEVAGIDMISEDISRPWFETETVINEVNFRPQIGENTARTFMDLSFPAGQSQVRIECFVGGGGDAMNAATERRAELARGTGGAFLTSHNVSLDDQGNTIHFSKTDSLFRRSELLLQEKSLSYLIAVVQNDEMLATRLPFLNIAAIHKVGGSISKHRDSTQPATAADFTNLIDLLETYRLGEDETLQQTA